MILQTTINGRPATAAFLNGDTFEPVDDENLATLVEVRFTDAQGGMMFLVPKAHTSKSLRGFDPDEPRDEQGRWTEGGGSGGGEGADEKPAAADRPAGEGGDGGKKKAEMADFAKDDVTVDDSTRTDPEKQKKFIETWNGKIGEAPAEFRNSFLGGLKGSMNIRFNDADNSMFMSGLLRDERDNRIGEYQRTIDFERNEAISNYFKLRDAETGGSIGKTMLAANMKEYQKLGIDEVKVHADIDVGGYAWARYGYVPTDASWRNLSADLEQKIDELSGGGGSFIATSWEELTAHQQGAIENAWKRSTRDEMYDYEVESWRDSGQALETVKTELVAER